MNIRLSMRQQQHFLSTMGKEYYRKAIIDCRAAIARERENKKKDNERYAAYIRNASTPSSKATYRKQKVDASARHDREIENLKKRIESYQRSMKACRD